MRTASVTSPATTTSSPYWEVLNEVDFEHQTTPEQYTERYDAIVDAIHNVSPEMKFMGLAVAAPQRRSALSLRVLPRPRNIMRPGPAGLDFLSLLRGAALSEDIETGSTRSSIKPTDFSTDVRYMEAFASDSRPRRRPIIDELGVDLPTDELEDSTGKAGLRSHPAALLERRGPLYAYLFIDFRSMGIDVIGESQLVGYPTQFPSVSMMDWKNGKPNARYWVLKLHQGQLPCRRYARQDRVQPLERHRRSGLRHSRRTQVPALNRHNRPAEVTLPPGITSYTLSTVDGDTGDDPPRVAREAFPALTLAPFAVAVLSWK